MRKLASLLLLALCLCSVASAQTTSTVAAYGYTLGAAPAAAISDPKKYVTPTSTSDVFLFKPARPEQVEIIIEEPGAMVETIRAYNTELKRCLSRASLAQCQQKLSPRYGPGSLPGLHFINLTMGKGERLIVRAKRFDDGSGVVDLVLGTVSGKRTIKSVKVADLLNSNLLLPMSLVGSRTDSKLGGYNGQPTILLSAAVAGHDRFLAQLDRHISSSPILSGIAALIAPAPAYAQQGPGGARVYTMNGFGQGRSDDADTFAGDMEAVEEAANRNGADVDMRQVLYTDSWRGKGLCETARAIAEQIMKDLENDPLEDDEKLCIAGHSFGGLLALIMKANPNCLPPGFPAFCVYAYDPPVAGVAIPSFFAFSQLSQDMLPGSAALTSAIEVSGDDVKRRSRKDRQGNDVPFNENGDETTPDHDPYNEENRDKDKNKKERSEVRRELLDMLGVK